MDTLYKYSVSLLLFIILAGCGGGGSDSSVGSESGEDDIVTVIDSPETNDEVIQNGSVMTMTEGQYSYFQYSIVAGKSYKVALTMTYGDADLMVFDQNILHLDNLIGLSNNPYSQPEEVSFSSVRDLDMVIEVYAYTNTEFRLDIREIQGVTIDPHLEDGFPVPVYFTPGTYKAGSDSIFVSVGNIDDDDELEILMTGTATGPLWAWNHDGTLLPGWPEINGNATGYVAIGNVDDNSSQAEVVAGYGPFYGSCEDDQYVMDGSGTVLPGWPKTSCLSGTTRPARLVDLNNDGKEEIIFGDSAYYGDGTEVTGWPVTFYLNDPVIMSFDGRRPMAAGDLDNDGEVEIVYSEHDYLVAFNPDGSLQPGFPKMTSSVGILLKDMVMGDVNNDGYPEIIRLRKIQEMGRGLLLEVFDSSGELLWSRETVSSVPYNTSPALADMDGDNVPEIIVQTEGALTVWTGDGSLLPGWPVEWELIPGMPLSYSDVSMGNSSPVVGDVNGDLQPEIVIVSNMNDAEGLIGRIKVYTKDGIMLDGFPKELPIGDSMVPAIADIDLDGRNEIMVGSTAWMGKWGLQYALWVFDLGNGPHGKIEWGQLGGDSRHRGIYPVP